MPVNANIALGVQPVQLPNIQDLALQRTQMMNYMSEIASRNRTLMEQKNIAAIAGQPDFDPDNPIHAAAIIRGGGSSGAAALSSFADIKAKKIAAENEILKQHQTQALQSITTIATMPDKEHARAMLEARRADGQLRGEDVDAMLQQLDSMEFPAFQVQLIRQAAQRADPNKAAETRTYQTDNGGENVINTQNVMGGPLTEVGRFKKTPTPGELLTDKRQKATQGIESKKATFQADNAGNITAFAPDGKSIVGYYPATGRTSATYEKNQEAGIKGVTDIDRLDPLLADALKPGGLIDKAGGGGVTVAANQIARMTGQTTKEMEAQAALNPIADLVLKMVPRFEGPQSDKDTQSYKDAAGKLTDPMATAGEKRAAAKVIQGLLKSRRNQFVTLQDQRGGGVARIPGAPTTNAPAGAVQWEMGPDGVPRPKQ